MIAEWLLFVQMTGGWPYVAVDRYPTEDACMQELIYSKRWEAMVAWRIRSGIPTGPTSGPVMFCQEEK